MDGLFFLGVGKMKNLNKKGCKIEKFFSSICFFILSWFVLLDVRNLILHFNFFYLVDYYWSIYDVTMLLDCDCDLRFEQKRALGMELSIKTTVKRSGVTLASVQSHAWIFRLLLKISVDRGKIMSLKPTFFGLLCLLDQEVCFICECSGSQLPQSFRLLLLKNLNACRSWNSNENTVQTQAAALLVKRRKEEVMCC